MTLTLRLQGAAAAAALMEMGGVLQLGLCLSTCETNK